MAKNHGDGVSSTATVMELLGGLKPAGGMLPPAPARSAAVASAADATVSSAITELMRVLRDFAGFKQTEYLRGKLEHTFRSAKPFEVWELVTRISGSRSSDELAALVENLTNHETYFFRDRPQLDVLKSSILPKLIEEKLSKGERRIRIWSAACATGEEPYSLAMLAVQCLLERKLAYEWAPGEVRMPPDWSLEILGSDISRQAVRIAREATFSTSGLASFRQFPTEFLRFFADTGAVSDQEARYRVVKGCIRRLVRIERSNLMDLNPPWNGVDLILCRNVMIYIDASKQAGIERMLARALRPGGILMLSPVDNIQNKPLFRERWYERCLVYERN